MGSRLSPSPMDVAFGNSVCAFGYTSFIYFISFIFIVFMNIFVKVIVAFGYSLLPGHADLCNLVIV